MQISVLIPTYNSAKTIQATLDSVLQQTRRPDEILVLDDGSTDNTVSLLDSYKPWITVLEEQHKGAASARNALCEAAQGELLAFLDSDDIWHQSYLDVQHSLFGKYPDAVASFTGHLNFYGYGNYQWNTGVLDVKSITELMTPANFFKRYNKATGPFASMSYLCIPKHALRKLGTKPFDMSLTAAIDSYLLYSIAPSGPIVYMSLPLVAYRIIKESLSANRLKSFGAWVKAFELLEDQYEQLLDVNLSKEFRLAFASKRRQYAKILMGAGRALDARTQLWYSVKNSKNAQSIAKSLVLFICTYMPTSLQPSWPSSYRA